MTYRHDGNENHVTKEFEFSVTKQHRTGWDAETYTIQTYDDFVYSADLHHQCDVWNIGGSYNGLPKPEVIARLELFIEEANEALAALRSMS